MEKALAGVHQAHQEGPGALTLLFVGRDGRVGIGLQCEDEMEAVIVGALLANYPNSAAGATRGGHLRRAAWNFRRPRKFPRVDQTCPRCRDTQSRQRESGRNTHSRRNPMLVLTRKKEETIVIDGQITIKVVRLSGNRVRLGIQAPQDIAICRGEVSKDVIDQSGSQNTPSQLPLTDG
jgi:carbon storage regulator